MLTHASTIDTSSCDREPIHIPGVIQAFGVLLTIDADLRIEQITDNADQLLHQHPAQLMGQPLSSLFSPSERNALIAKLSDIPSDRRISFVFHLAFAGNSERLYAQVHRYAGKVIVEIEPAGDQGVDSAAQSFAVHDAIERITSSRDLSQLCEIVTTEVQALTGYDRVMVYRFDENWNGSVVAETLSSPNIDSYRGLWFPASDIPQQARKMFTQNWLRMIPTTEYRPAAILPHDQPPLDLSLTLLRSPSPIHLEYMRNMRVGASLTVSILHEGKLWGLIACHQNTPKWVDYQTRNTCELFGKLVSSLIGCKEAYDDHDYRMALRKTNEDLVRYMASEEDFVRGLVKYSPNLLDVTSSTGAAAAVYFSGKWTVIGRVPQLHDINTLVKWLKTRMTSTGVYATNCLSKDFPDSGRYKDIAAGLVAISIPKSEENYVLWFRPEVIQTVTWAGNPEKSVEMVGTDLKLHPRKSFNLWKQSVADTSLPWKPAEIEAASDLRRSIIEIDLERQFRREQEARAEANLDKKRVEFLSDVSKALAYTLDYSVTLSNVAQLSVRGFCDWCVIYLFDNGNLLRATVAHATPEGQKVADELFRLPAPSPHGLNVLAEVFTTGQIRMVSRVDNDWLREYAPDEEQFTYFKNRLGLESYLATALVSRGKRLGIIEFANCESKRYFGEADRDLAEELSRRAAIAIDNAQLFRELKTQYESAENANRIKEEVLAVVSHDLKNPVRSVLFNAELIQRSQGSDPDKRDQLLNDCTRNITVSAMQMKHLIDDLLDVAKIESKAALALEIHPHAVASIISEVLAILEPLAVQKSITIQREIPAPDDILRCDCRRLQQVLSNLIGNAIKFTEPGGSILLKVVKREGDYLFTVRDNGIGIPKEQLPQIFDRFWQGQSGSKDGLGLGLAIAKSIVEAHGGRIWVDSVPGSGSSFHFLIPNR